MRTFQDGATSQSPSSSPSEPSSPTQLRPLKVVRVSAAQMRQANSSFFRGLVPCVYSPASNTLTSVAQ